MRFGVVDQDQFVTHHLIPSQAASSETLVILSAYQHALESVLAMAGDDLSDLVLEGLYSNFVALKEVRQMLKEDLERADVTMEAIEARLTI